MTLRQRLCTRLLLTNLLLSVPLLAGAQATPAAPADLPALGSNWQLPNPYRGNAGVIAQGQQHFETHCASCHGHEASQATPEGPDLRRLDSFCLRLKDAVLKSHCVQDVDTYFLQSVREGKVRAGVRYMPAWEGVLSQEQMWAIKTYVESRRGPAK